MVDEVQVEEPQTRRFEESVVSKRDWLPSLLLLSNGD